IQLRKWRRAERLQHRLSTDVLHVPPQPSLLTTETIVMSILENRRPWKVVALVCICLPFGACNVKDQLLEPQNPGLVDPSAVNSPDAADALRIGALGSLRNVTAGSESLWMYCGLLTDEWKSSDKF